jgi:hypothetical protein
MKNFKKVNINNAITKIDIYKNILKLGIRLLSLITISLNLGINAIDINKNSIIVKDVTTRTSNLTNENPKSLISGIFQIITTSMRNFVLNALIILFIVILQVL